MNISAGPREQIVAFLSMSNDDFSQIRNDIRSVELAVRMSAFPEVRDMVSLHSGAPIEDFIEALLNRYAHAWNRRDMREAIILLREVGLEDLHELRIERWAKQPNVRHISDRIAHEKGTGTLKPEGFAQISEAIQGSFDMNPLESNMLAGEVHRKVQQNNRDFWSKMRSEYGIADWAPFDWPRARDRDRWCATTGGDPIDYPYNP